MKIRIEGCVNNHLVIHTYEIAPESVATATADGKRWFEIDAPTELDLKPYYALMKDGSYVGMVMFWSNPGRAVLGTFCTDERVTIIGEKLHLHPVTETQVEAA